MDTLLGDYRTGTAQDADTAGAITAALLAYYTSSQVDALLGDYRTANRRRRPSRARCTTNQITSAVVAYRSAADQDTATTSSIAAALLSYYTIAQVDGLLAGKLGVTEVASALQNTSALSGRRRGRRGGGRHRRADPGPHGRLAVKLDGSPQQRLQRGPGHAHRGRSERGWLHPDPGGEPGGVHVRGRQRLRPPIRQLCGRPGRLEHAKMYFTVPPNGVAKLHFGAHFQAPGLPNQTAGTDPGRNPGDRQRSGGRGGHGGLGAAAEARVPRRRGRRRHAGHPGRGAAGAHAHHARQFSGALQQPELRGLGQLHGGRLPDGGLRHDPERLRLEHRARLRADAGETLLLRLPVQAGHGSAADNDYVGVTGTFLGTALQGVCSTARLDFSVPPGGIAKLHFGAFGGSIPGLVQQSAGSTACRSGPRPLRESRSQ